MFKDWELPEDVKEAMEEMGSYGLAKSTWSAYKTAERQLGKCQKEKKTDMSLPLSKEKTVVFIDWLIRDRKVKATTINSYLSGIRQLHISRGMDPPNLRPAAVNLLLKGKQHLDNIEERKWGSPGRLPVTITILKLLKAGLIRADMDNVTKILTWTVCCMAFHGSFRIHELLCQVEDKFDPDFTLLRKDVKLFRREEGPDRLEVTLKCPKESKRGKKVVVDLFETKGETCPIAAFKKWEKNVRGKENEPAFIDAIGRPLTGRRLNKIVKSLLESHINYKTGKITSHSFRAGMASLLAAKGFEEEEIKISGRWNSRAFELYTKLPRTKREEIARRLGTL